MMKPKPLPILIALATTLALTTGGCMENPAAPPQGHGQATLPPPVVTPVTSRDLLAFFASHDYGWETLDRGVPPFVLGALPEDIDRIPRIDEKKKIFFLSLLPMVLMVNEEILLQRRELKAIFARHDAGGPLSSDQDKRLRDLIRQYRIRKDPLSDPAARERLLKRVDVIPPSMVLAQAANESGWGTSRFARQGNNLFGEWSFGIGSGLIPKQRPVGETYEVRRFPTLYDSVRSYMRNINTHWAYQPLRNQRALRRAEGLPLRGLDLAQGLKPYSIRGEAYVEEIRTIIRQNSLALLTAATLRRS